MFNLLSTYDYDLPEGLIAQHPLKERSASRLLVLDPDKETLSHQHFHDVIDLINPNDLIVFNNTRVIPARLFGQKESGGKIECLIERVLDQRRVLSHIRSSKSPKPGSNIVLGAYTAQVVARHDDLFELQFLSEKPVYDILDELGQMPLPPYIERNPDADDSERYQTVYAKEKGAVAAPTAGLHWTADLIAALKEKGVSLAEVTLHVGAGTFQPVRVDNLDDHHMHSEWIDVSQTVVDAVADCRARGGRVIAVGTTTLRSLESAAKEGALSAYKGETDLFIRPGYVFNAVDVLITNFHLPKSTLLMLVAAFAGFKTMMHAYHVAIAKGYRFFSYGDAMWVPR